MAKEQIMGLYMPGRKVGDPTVNELSHLKYSASGTIKYNVFSGIDDYQTLPIRLGPIVEHQIRAKPLYKKPLKITKKKFEDLQAMNSTILKNDHAFYDNLKYYTP